MEHRQLILRAAEKNASRRLVVCAERDTSQLNQVQFGPI